MNRLCLSRGWIGIGCLVVAIGCNPADELRRRQVENNLKQIELALQAYQRTYATTESPQATETVPTPNASSPADLSSLVQGNNEFAWDLYQQLKNEPGNLFYSPTSISTALAMTYAGSSGVTRDEIAKTMHFAIPEERFHPAMTTLQEFWKMPVKEKGFQLSVANRLWGQRDQDFEPPFVSVTRDHYDAEIERLDFGNSEGARRQINDWVANRTANKITDLIPKGLINEDTKLVLTNAVYFLGDWKTPFDKSSTRPEDFFVDDSKTVPVPMMTSTDNYNYGETDALQMLEMPYGDGSLSMLVLLPKQKDGLPELETELTGANVAIWKESLGFDREVEVYFPRFKITSQFGLAETLAAMGMPSAFDAKTADFTRMTGHRDLYVSSVVHKAFVDVNEKGTEAAAATGVIMAPTASIEEPPPPPVFRADHPFVFLIQDTRNDSILFIGRINDPVAD